MLQASCSVKFCLCILGIKWSEEAMGSCFSCPDKESIPDNHQSKFKVSIYQHACVRLWWSCLWRVELNRFGLVWCVQVVNVDDDGNELEQASWSWWRTSWSCAHANAMLSSGLTCACAVMATIQISFRLRVAVAARQVKVKLRSPSLTLSHNILEFTLQMFNVFKEVSSAHQACIYLIPSTAKVLNILK